MSAGARHLAQDSAASPDRFLKWSMDKYGTMKSLRSVFTIKEELIDGSNTEEVFSERRVFDFQSPNRFKINSNMFNLHFLTVVSDGQKVMVVRPGSEVPAKYSPAPPNIFQGAVKEMANPSQAGSRLYAFFGGSANYGKLVDETKGPVTFGPEGTAPGGEHSRTVKFFSAWAKGPVSVVIGEKTGLVYQLEYDANVVITEGKTKDVGIVPQKDTDMRAHMIERFTTTPNAPQKSSVFALKE
jgi:hypothetical protein